jgi:hypothetical protein
MSKRDLTIVSKLNRLRPNLLYVSLDIGGFTPLHASAKNLQLDTVQFLLSFGADPNFKVSCLYDSMRLVPNVTLMTISAEYRKAFAHAILSFRMDMVALYYIGRQKIRIQLLHSCC